MKALVVRARCEWNMLDPAAADLVDEGVRLARELGEPALLARALVGGGGYLTRGPHRHREMLDEAVVLAGDIGDADAGLEAHAWQAISVINSGEPGLAARLLEHTEAMAAAVGNAYGVRAVQGFRGLVLVMQGRGREALLLIDDIAGIADCLELLACLGPERIRPEQAARMLGAASAARDRVGARGPAVHEGAVATADSAAQDALGAEAYAAARGAGTGLPVGEAATYALRGRGERKRPRHGWASLTPTEKSVVGLVAAGLVNKEIAARLFVSPRTVEAHLNHVYAKLGVRTRVALAQEAARHARLSCPKPGRPPLSGPSSSGLSRHSLRRCPRRSRWPRRPPRC